MMHTLVLLRHAKSDWATGERDHDRPLAKRGLRQAPVAGQWLRDHAVIDLAVVSTATRARQTWALASAELSLVPPERFDPVIYGASSRELRALLRALPEDAGTVALVGHNPTMEDLVHDLTGEDVLMKTSAIAVIDVPGPWARAETGAATLRAWGRPPTT